VAQRNDAPAGDPALGLPIFSTVLAEAGLFGARPS
jgi:hypothetical protein